MTKHAMNTALSQHKGAKGGLEILRTVKQTARNIEKQEQEARKRQASVAATLDANAGNTTRRF